MNYTTGQWSAAVGHIQRDEVDYALCCISNTYARSKAATFSQYLLAFPLVPDSQVRSLNLGSGNPRIRDPETRYRFKPSNVNLDFFNDLRL